MAPVEIQSKLRSLRARLRAFFLIDGLTRLAAVTVAVLSVSIFFDWLTSPSLPQFMRWTLLLCGLAIIGFVAWRRLISPLRVKLEEDDMAIAVERANPALNDRLISTVQLARVESRPDFGASREMVRELVSETSAATAAMDFRRALDARALRAQLIAGGTAVVFALALTTLSPNSVLTGLARYFAPFSGVEWQARTRLTVGNVPLLTAKGETLKLEVRQDGFERYRGTILYRYPDLGEKWERQRVLAGDDGVLRAEIRNLVGSLEFYATAGDGRSRVHRVEVVERPGVKQVTLRYNYPAYTGLEAELGQPGHGNARAVIGTRVRVGARFNQKVTSALLIDPHGVSHPMTIDTAAGGDFGVGEFEVTKNGHYRIALESEHLRTDASGEKRRFTFANATPARYAVRAEADRPPDVRVEYPGTDIDVKAQAVIPLRALVRDDFGVASTRIVYGISNLPGEKTITLSSGNFGKPAVGLTHRWDLAPLNLKPGTAVSYRVLARDFRPEPGPNQGSSEVFHLRVTSGEDFDGETARIKRGIRDELLRLIRLQEANKDQVESLRTASLRGDDFDRNARHKAAMAESEQRAIGRRTGSLREKIEKLQRRLIINRAESARDDAELSEMTIVLGRLEREKMPAAAAAIRDGRLAKLSTGRIEHLGTAVERQVKIIAELKSLLKKTDKWQATDELLRLARALLRKEQEIFAGTVAAGRSGEFRDGKISSLPKPAKNKLAFLRRSQTEASGDMSVLEEKMLTALRKLNEAVARRKVSEALRIAHDVNAAPGAEPGPAEQRRSVRETMDEAVKSLDGLRLGSAAGQQKLAVGALQRIVRALSEDVKRDHEGIRRALINIRETLTEAADQERGHIRDTGALSGSRAAKLGKIRGKLEGILKDQRGISAQTRGGKGDDQDLAHRQGELRERTEKIARELGNLIGSGKNPGKAAEGAAAAAGSMSKAETALNGPGGEGKPSAGSPKSGKPKADSPSGGKPSSGKPSSGSPSSGAPSSGGSGKGGRGAAGKHQGQAEVLLKRVLEIVRKEEKNTTNNRPQGPAATREAERIRGRQKATRELAETLRKMIETVIIKHKLPELHGTGEKVKKAGGKMGQAEGHLTRGEPKDAEDDEEDALQQLITVIREVDGHIDRNNWDQLQEELFKIEKELREILAIHKRVIVKTLEVQNFRKRNRRAKLARPQVRRLFDASKAETDAMNRTRKTVRRIPDCPVFAWMLDDTAGDMKEVRDLLEKKRTGMYVQDIENDVKRKLEDLIAALQKERAKGPKKPPKTPPGRPPRGGAPRGKPPLVPPLAELKMLRKLQEDVNRKTKWVDDMVARTADKKLTGELKPILERAAQKQGDVAGLTKKLAEQVDGRPHDGPVPIDDL
jgi:hypothetical protein